MAQSLQTQKPVQTTPSAEEIAAALSDAQQTMYKVGTDPAFLARCKERGLNPTTDVDKTEYWDAFAEHVQDHVSGIREKDGDTLKTRAIELLGTTPVYALEEHALIADQYSDPKKLTHAKEIASYYNNLLREFALTYPEVRVSDVVETSLKTICMSVEDKETRDHAEQNIHSAIHGAQHELAYGQILAHTGHEFRPADLDEDLHGIDYVILSHKNTPTFVDVKASMYKIEKHTKSGQPYYYTRDGHLVMYSLTHDEEFGDRFFIDDAAAAAKAPELEQILDHSRQAASAVTA